MKPKLQSVTDYKVMSLMECAKALKWEVKEDETKFYFTCDCGKSEITYSGFLGTEVIECENCKKRITDLTSPIQTGNSTCSILKISEYEVEKDKDGNDRFWVADDGNGGIKESEGNNEQDKF